MLPAAHLSPAGQPQVATAVDMLTRLEGHLEDSAPGRGWGRKVTAVPA